MKTPRYMFRTPIILKSTVSRNGAGEPVSGGDRAIRVLWVDHKRRIKNAKGETIVSEARLISPVEIKEIDTIAKDGREFPVMDVKPLRNVFDKIAAWEVFL